MMTFLPFENFEKCARVLDDKRLYKQIVECKQILIALEPNSKSKWKNHPIVKMWFKYENALRYYQFCMLKEWVKRRWDVTIEYLPPEIPTLFVMFKHNYPKWLGDKELHLSHQSNLLRKNPEHYKRFFKNVPDNLPYKWVGEE